MPNHGLARLDEFQKRLRETGAYRTDPARQRPLLGRFDAWYYLRLAHLIYSGHRLIRNGKFDDRLWAAHAFDFLSILEDCGATIDISGVEHPAGVGRPSVFIGNHMSMIESFLLPGMLLHIDRVSAVIKTSLFKYPFLGSIARYIDPIGVDRRDPRQDLKTVLVQGKKALEGGRSVVIFPQATRSAVFDPSSFNTLGVKLAKSAGASVIPLALKTDFHGNGKLIKDVGPLHRDKTIHFKFGEPLTIRGNGRGVNEKVVRFITEALKEWGGEAPGRP